MRFLHIADLHIGKRLGEFSLIEDQRAVLDQLAAIAAREQVDAVLIAGDVYQRSAPQAEAMEVFDGFLTALSAQGLRVFLISGNHDSDRRLSYFARLIRGANVFAAGRFTGRLQRFELKDAYGRLHVHLLPFLRPAQARRFFPEEDIEDTEDAVRAVIAHSEIDPEARNVLVCHQFITGAATSESEEHMIGGLDNVSAAEFDAFDYVALGHLHRPQKIGRESLRYAGSPLKYSLSEADHRKSAAIVELKAKGEVAVRTVPLEPPHDLRAVRGLLAGVMDMPYSEDYVHVTLCDELIPPDARVTLLTNFPNLLRVSVENAATAGEELPPQRDVKELSVGELFEDFYRLQNEGVAPGRAVMAELEKALLRLEEHHEAD